MRLTLKAKVLTTIISLSVVGLTVFGYVSFKTYQEDKLAFVYDYLTNQTQSNSKLFNMASEDYEILLSSIISKIDLKNTEQSDVVTFLEGDQKRITGLYYHIPAETSLNQVTMFQAQNAGQWGWAKIHDAPFGLSLIDNKSGNFVFKKVIGQNNAYAAITFKQFDLWNMLNSKDGNYNFILSKNKVMSKSAVDLDQQVLMELKQQVAEAPGISGLLNTTINEVPYFVSFSKLGSDQMLLLNMISEKKILLVQQTFMHQVVSFLVIMASVSLLIGALSSRWLTWNIDKLTHAAREIENENFDVIVDITTKDELETLGTAFNSMNSKIRTLLEELRMYARELEDKVRERTKELQNLTDIQKGMLNALGQGFVIVNKEHKVLPVYSKVAEDMFEVVPDQSEPYQIMGVDQEQGNTFREFFEMVFSDMIPFEDMTRIAPDMRSNHKNQKIQLSYAPITSGDGSNAFEYVLIVGTDKTVEYENMEKFKKEWNHSQMISKVAGNRFAFIKILGESLNMLNKCADCIDHNEDYAVRTVQRIIHTIKGSFSYFYMQELTEKCHALESSLEPHYNLQVSTPELKVHIMNEVYTIQEYLESFIAKYDSIIQYKEAAKNRSVAYDDMLSFSQILDKKAPELKQIFTEKFFTAPIGLFFQMYPSIVKELGTKLNKDVRFTMVGGDTKIPDGPWEEIFANFIHFIRNSVDHGIEFPDARSNAGKPSFGTITFGFEMTEDQDLGKVLKINLQDDGGGIHWEKIAAKDPSVKSHRDAIERIKTGGVSSKDEVSDISGRGVGVSSLFSAVANYGGKADMESEPGKGTILTIELPLKTGKAGLKLAA